MELQLRYGYNNLIINHSLSLYKTPRDVQLKGIPKSHSIILEKIGIICDTRKVEESRANRNLWNEMGEKRYTAILLKILNISMTLGAGSNPEKCDVIVAKGVGFVSLCKGCHSCGRDLSRDRSYK